MDGVLRGLPFLFVYLDDILVTSPRLDAHINHIRQLFVRLQDAGLAINRDKCVFGAPSVTFLEHSVSSKGICPLPSKVDAIRSIPRPITMVDLQRFLGCINFYHRFLPNIATILTPFHALTSSAPSQKHVLDWQPEHLLAFSQAKQKLSQASMLVHPDPSAVLSLTADVSDVAVGAVLGQGASQDPLAFFSKKLSPAERKYCAFDRELLALYLAVKHFRPHVEGRNFVIYTDRHQGGPTEVHRLHQLLPPLRAWHRRRPDSEDGPLLGLPSSLGVRQGEVDVVSCHSKK